MCIRDRAECYSTLGLIHDMYHPLPNRFKDYISTPKPNGYQLSLIHIFPSPAAPAAAKEDSYSAKTHLHQPVPVTEMATVAATALPANAPEGTLPSEVRPEIVTWEKLVEAIKASGKAYNMAMIEKRCV